MASEFSKSDQHALMVKPTLDKLIEEKSLTDYGEIAQELNQKNLFTVTGKEYTKKSVHYLVKRIENLEDQGLGEHAGRRLKPLNSKGPSV